MRCGSCRSIPLLRFLWRIALFLTVGTPRPIESYFHRAPSSSSSSLAIIRRNLPPPILIPATRQRRPQIEGQDVCIAAISSSRSNTADNGDHQKDARHPKSKYDGMNDHLRVIFEKRSSLDRRSWLLFMLLGGSSSMLVNGSVQPLEFQIGTAAVANAAATEITESKGNDTVTTRKLGKLTDPIVQSLVFEKILGAGSYKTVYLVSATIPAAPNANGGEAAGPMQTFRYALAVERLRTKRDVKNALRGVQIPEMIRQGLHDNGNDGELFETIVDWWIQLSNIPEFEKGQRLFPAAAVATAGADMDKILRRTRSEPKKNFVGSRYMLSFKPVYDTDFKRFIRNAPVLVPVGTTLDSGKLHRDKSARSGELPASLNNYWTEPVLMAFVLEILHAGRLMHEAGIVHRDIKPKNMMIYTVPTSSGVFVKRPVIIDYGYSELGSPLLLEPKSTNALEKKKKDICVVRAGQLKGEVDYVLVEDLEEYRGCQRGDAYAMGKTLYEFVFGSADLQLRPQDRDAISVEGAETQNRAFRNRLTNASTAGTESRFPLSKGAADCLLTIIRGLCGTVLKDGTSTLSFAEAEGVLSDYLSQS